jgi:type III pantothenate kinase
MANCDLIAVDVGNSFVKLQAGTGLQPPWTEVDELRLETRRVADDVWDQHRLRDWLGCRDVATPARWIVASVHREAEQQLNRWVLAARPGDSYRRLVRDEIPLDVDVLYPDRVGIDRLLDAWAVNHVRDADRPAIVIDAGSAVTVDAVRADGCFLGGAILPGLRMAAAALSQATSQLPLIEPAGSGSSQGISRPDMLSQPDLIDHPDIIGRSTQDAIRGGVFWGTVGAIREITQRMDQQLGGNAHVFATGGDATRLRALLGENVEFHPNLVLSGIRLLSDRLRERTSS